MECILSTCNEENFEIAPANFQSALRNDNDFAPAYLLVASVYSIEGKFDDVICNFQETLKRDKLNSYFYPEFWKLIKTSDSRVFLFKRLVGLIES